MRLARCELREVCWQLGGGGPASWQAMPPRQGTLLRLTDTAGNVGLGEASPLDDGVAGAGAAHDDAAAALRRFAAFCDGAAPTLEAADAFAQAMAPGAARFAVETALLGLAANAGGVALAEALRFGAEPAWRVPINAVVTSVESARAALARGITTFKVKLGDDTAADARLLGELRDALRAKIQLRGDANRGWPEAEVADRMAALAFAALEYIEEPCRDVGAALRAAEATDQAIALDESVAELSLEELQRHLTHPQVAAIILKPTRLGLWGSLQRAELAHRLYKPAIVTHALEGPIATAACAELARALAARQPAELAVGLDAHPGLAAWTVAVPQLHTAGSGHLRAAPDSGLGLEHRWKELLP